MGKRRAETHPHPKFPLRKIARFSWCLPVPSYGYFLSRYLHFIIFLWFPTFTLPQDPALFTSKDSPFLSPFSIPLLLPGFQLLSSLSLQLPQLCALNHLYYQCTLHSAIRVIFLLQSSPWVISKLKILQWLLSPARENQNSLHLSNIWPITTCPIALLPFYSNNRELLGTLHSCSLFSILSFFLLTFLSWPASVCSSRIILFLKC